MGRGSPICCANASFRKGHWTSEEDELLKAHLKCHGDRQNWSRVPEAAGLHRSGKSCRLRWVNYLKPDLKRGDFSGDEEDLIAKLHSLLGNRWSLIAGRIPGRTDNEIKNYWNSHLRKKVLSMANTRKKSRARVEDMLPSQLDHGDILVVKECPLISSSCSASQQQLDCSNSSASAPSPVQQPTHFSLYKNTNWIQYDELVISTMEQLQADISLSIEQEQVEQQGDPWDWDFSEDMTFESNGLLEVLEWL